MLEWLKKRKKHEDRTWDFEGRCEECGRPLKLYMNVETRQKIILEVENCADHLGKAVILWPQREDVIRNDNLL